MSLLRIAKFRVGTKLQIPKYILLYSKRICTKLREKVVLILIWSGGPNLEVGNLESVQAKESLHFRTVVWQFGPSRIAFFFILGVQPKSLPGILSRQEYLQIIKKSFSETSTPNNGIKS